MKMKKLLAIVLSVMLLIGLLPASALAAPAPEEVWDESNGAPTISVEASELGDDGTMSVSVKIAQPEESLSVYAYALLLQYDSDLVEVDESKGDDLFEDGTTYGLSYDKKYYTDSLTINTNWNDATSGPKIFFITDAKLKGFGKTGVTVTFYFKLKEGAFGGAAVFELVNVDDSFLIQAADSSNNKYFALFPTENTSVSVALPKLAVTPTISAIADQTYTGAEIKPAVTVTCTPALTETTDYTVEYKDNIDAGTATVTIKSVADSGYKFDDVSAQFTINPLEVAVTWDTAALTYTGEAQAPKATATGVSGETLKLKVDGAQTDAGTGYKATASIESVTGGRAKAENYKLTGDTATFNIGKADYSGAPITCAVTVPTKAVTDKELAVSALGLDETFVDPQITAAGDADGTLVTAASLKDASTAKFSTADAVADATGSFKVTVSSKNWNEVQVTVNVTAKALEITDADWAKVTTKDVEYGQTNADAVTVPESIKVKDALGNEHTAYLELQEKDKVNNAGDATATVKLSVKDGEYAGFEDSHTYDYKVAAKEVAVTWDETALEYTGAAQAPAATAEGVNGETLKLKVDGAQTNAGTGYTATASIESVTGGNAKAENYKLTGETKTFDIAKKAVKPAIDAIADQTYTGAEIKPAVTVTCDPALTETTDYTVEYKDNIDAGTATVTLKSVDASNYTFEAVTANFTIKPLEVAVTWDTAALTYTGEAQAPKATAAGVSGETLKLKVDGAQTDAGTGYKATASIESVTGGRAKAENYKLTGDTTTFDIGKADYTGTAITYDVTVPTKGATDKEIAISALGLDKTFVDPQITAAGDADGSLVTAASVKDASTAKFSTKADVAADTKGSFTITVSSKNWNDYKVTVNVVAKALEITAEDWAQVKTADVEYGKTNADAVTVPESIKVKDALGNEHTAYLELQEPTKVFDVGTAAAVVTLTVKDGEYAGFTEDHTYNYNVTPKSVDVTWTETELTYTGSAQAPKASAKGIDGAELTLTVSGEQTDAGTYTATAALDAAIKNYELNAESASTEFTIKPAEFKNSVAIKADADPIVEGTTLTADITDAKGDKLSYQWKRDGADIEGAASETYQVTADDVGTEITVTVTSAGNYEGELTSEAVKPLGPPTFESVSATGEVDTMTVAWSVKDNGSPITGYTVTVSHKEDGDKTVSVAADATSVEIPELKVGETYTVQVTATNAIGSTDSDKIDVLMAYEEEELYTITVVETENGKVEVSATESEAGERITVKVVPDEGYEFDVLKIIDAAGSPVKFTENKGSYSFTMPESNVKIKATFKATEEEKRELPFVDVEKGSVYEDAVYWAWIGGVTNGTSETTFSPYEPCTRAEAVTFLWRNSECPEPTITECPFTDVTDPEAYYYKAVLWAYENGITKGTSETEFSPEKTVTRAQMITFVYRMTGEKAEAADIPFVDVDANAYYAEAVMWAVTNGVTNGTSETTFSPNEQCLRYQVVTFLYRYFQ